MQNLQLFKPQMNLLDCERKKRKKSLFEFFHFWFRAVQRLKLKILGYYGGVQESWEYKLSATQRYT